MMEWAWPAREDAGLLERLRGMYERAYEAARGIGRIVGRVARYSPVETGPGSLVAVEVDPEEYWSRPESPVHRVGDYLAAVDPKTLRLILLRVSKITRLDALAAIGAEPPVSGYVQSVDPSGAATRTLVLAEPVVEAPIEGGEPVPAVTSLEPQSPVVEPGPETLERLLSLPGEGLLLGVLSGPWGPLEGGVAVRLPYKAVLQHVLIVGTTGSGKTTLMKNMVASAYSIGGRGRPVVVILDLNQDYIQLPFPGSPPPAWAERAYRRVRPPRGVVVVVPVSRDLLVDAGWDGCGGLEGFYEWYASRYIEPLSPGAGLSSSIGGGLRRGVIEAGGARIVLVPYAIDTTGSRTEELLGLLPGLSLLARELLRRVREKFRREYESYPPLPLVAGALLARIMVRHRRGGRDEGLEAGLELVEAGLVGSPEGGVANLGLEGLDPVEGLEALVRIIERGVPSDRTVEALYRRVSGLLESGLVDILGACGREARVLGEPGWDGIVGLAAEEDMPVVVDLKPASESGLGGYEGPRAVAYRMLQRLISWKQGAYARRRSTPRVLVVLDEAHQFFPQEKGPAEEQEANKQVAAMISRVARLGRARGLGLMFATHSPRDLHDIIVQLANTKIVLRTEPSQLEKLRVPPGLDRIVSSLPDRMVAVSSHVYRNSYMLAMTPPPLVMHYDVSYKNI